MSNQFVKIGSDGKPLKPNHPTIASGELAGSLDYNVDLNRWNINYFGLHRLRLLALFGGSEINPTEMSEFWANLETSRNGDDFGDESGDEISDASVIRAVSLNTKLNAYLNNAAQTEHTGIFWMRPFVDLNKHASRDEARMFASAVDTALDILKGEIIQVLSHEQYDYYEGFVAWILDPDDNWEAIGFNF
tara:strand:- start:92 stop:661 length:570 start_codon:yes stop_codon:yes gene_type:complete